MPFRYRYLPERHVHLEALYAEVTLEQVVAMKTQQRDAEIGGLGLRALVDLRQARARFETGQVRVFGEWMRAQLPGQLDTRSALLASSPVETGLSLLYASDMRQIKTVEVFTTLAAALEWLGLEPELVAEHADIIPVDRDVRER